MRGGAGTGPGRECAALMRDLRAGESFDIVEELGRADFVNATMYS